MNGISALRKETPERSPVWVLVFPASRTVRNKYWLSLSPPAYGIVLEQPDQTKTTGISPLTQQFLFSELP